MAGIGVAVRLALAPLTSYPQDDLPWYSMVVSGMQHLGVYARPGFSYPPLWGWVLELLGRILHGFGASPGALGVHDHALNQATAALSTGGTLATTITSPLLNLCVKGLLTAADLGTALLLAGLAPRLSERARASEVAFGLYFLNPLVINVTAVQAQIDGLVALTIAAAIAMAVRRRMLMAGMALSLGVFVKLTPVLVVPLVAVAVVSALREEGHGSEALRELGRLAAGLVLIAVPVFVALVGTGEWGGFIENTFSRTQTGLTIGGPAFGGIRHFAAFAGLLQTASRHSGTVLGASLAIEVLVLATMTVWVWFGARRSMLHALVLSTTVVFAVVVATTPTSQPEYVVWLLPTLVLLAAAKPGSYAPFVASLSLAAVVFSLTYYGPAQVLFPLAEYTKIVSPGSLAATVVHWFFRPTALWGASYKENYASVCAAVAIVSYLFLVARCVEDRSIVELEARAPGHRTVRWARPERAMAGVVGLCALAMVVSAATPAPPTGSTATSLTGARLVGPHLEVSFSSRPLAGARSLRVVSFPVSQTPVPRNVYVVVDPAMPLGATTLEDVRGVYDVLRATLRLRGYTGSTTMITAGGLTRLLGDGPPPDGIAVVDTSGVLPTAVLSPHHDMLLPWLRRGGVLYWGGGPMGLWHAAPGQARAGEWIQGPVAVLGPAAALRPTFAVEAGRPTATAHALGLGYQDVSYSPPAAPARSEGAAFLGYTGRGRSSITSFAFGTGRLVVFGGLMYQNAQVASDISLIQMSGVLYEAGPLSTSRAARWGRWTTTIIDPPSAIERVDAFDPQAEGIAFSGFTVDASRCHPMCRTAPMR